MAKCLTLGNGLAGAVITAYSGTGLRIGTCSVCKYVLYMIFTCEVTSYTNLVLTAVSIESPSVSCCLTLSVAASLYLTGSGLITGSVSHIVVTEITLGMTAYLTGRLGNTGSLGHIVAECLAERRS